MAYPQYNPDSGQVYTETTVTAQPRLRPWFTATKGSTKGLSKYRNGTGAASLWNMAVRVLLVNSASITAETLTGTQWHIGEKLWESLYKNDLISVAIWQAFVKAYHTEIAIHQPAGLVYHAHSPRIPSHSLQSRIPSKALVPALRKITTPNLEWLTILSILDTPLRRNEWIQLSSLTNLGTLYIHNTTHESAGGLDDVVIKSWSNSATESGAFPVMKFLMLQNQDGITLGTLEYFSKFPALKVVHLTGRTLRARDGEEAARCSRWSWMSQSSLCLKLFHMWFAAFSVPEVLREMHETVSRSDSQGKEYQRKPLLQVTSGQDSLSKIASRHDQLWFELLPLPAEDMTPAPLATEPVKVVLGAKRLKMRGTAHQSMADVLGNFGRFSG